MPLPKDPTKYPPHILALWLKAKQDGCVQVHDLTKSQATQLRFQLNGLRKALADTGHSLGQLLYDYEILMRILKETGAFYINIKLKTNSEVSVQIDQALGNDTGLLEEAEDILLGAAPVPKSSITASDLKIDPIPQAGSIFDPTGKPEGD